MRVRAKEECFIGGARRRVGEEFGIPGKKCPKCCEPANVKAEKKEPDKKEPTTFTETAIKFSKPKRGRFRPPLFSVTHGE